jgi:protoporphyrinogen oxidase
LRTPKKVDFLIIGAGPTGLGAAYHLRALGITNFLVVDKESVPGGLSRSHRDDQGFTWDIGGHVQFSHYDYFDKVMAEAIAPTDWVSHERESWVWMRERFIPYPFQNHLRYLPPKDLWACVEGLLEIHRRPEKPATENFQEWIRTVFGKGIADIFLNPYNFKVWATPLTQMSTSWMGERVATTDVAKSIQNIILAKDERSWGPNHRFQFPLQGGTGNIWNQVANLVGREHFQFDTVIERVEANKKIAYAADGREIAFTHCLSLMPLSVFCQKVPALGRSLVKRAAQLRHSTTHVVGLGLRGQPAPELRTKCWMYFPESDCPFYRATLFSNYSPRNVPDIKTQWSLMLEVSESVDKPVDRARVIEEVIQGCRNTGLITARDQIISRWHYVAPFGYPVPTVERDRILNDVQPAIEKLGLFSRGRFGGWKYEVSNQDHSFMQGVEWVERILLGVPEVTYPEGRTEKTRAMATSTKPVIRRAA